jgi:hypothetical protein
MLGHPCMNHSGRFGCQTVNLATNRKYKSCKPKTCLGFRSKSQKEGGLMPNIQIVLKVVVCKNNLLKDKRYWLFRWQCNQRKAEIQQKLDEYSEEMACLLFSRHAITETEVDS